MWMITLKWCILGIYDYICMCKALSVFSFPYQSSSEEESGESEGSTSLPPSKLAYQEGTEVEGARRGKCKRPPSRPTAPPPSQKLLLQHQQSRKRASALELRLKKRVKSWSFKWFYIHFFNYPVFLWSQACTNKYIIFYVNGEIHSFDLLVFNKWCFWRDLIALKLQLD